MHALTTEWIAKAEGDFASARRELRARRNPNYDSACFHAQQTTEKYLKAYLQEQGATIPRTHNHIELLRLCMPIEPLFHSQHSDLILIDRYAVSYRYPGDSADKKEARHAVRATSSVRAYIRSKLGLG
jgi:HEPN domain-containing protein